MGGTVAWFSLLTERREAKPLKKIKIQNLGVKTSFPPQNAKQLFKKVSSFFAHQNEKKETKQKIISANSAVRFLKYFAIVKKKKPLQFSFLMTVLFLAGGLSQSRMRRTVRPLTYDHHRLLSDCLGIRVLDFTTFFAVTVKETAVVVK